MAFTSVIVYHPTNEAYPNEIVPVRIMVTTEWRKRILTRVRIYEEPYGSLVNEEEDIRFISAYDEIPITFLMPSSGYVSILAETFLCPDVGLCDTTRDALGSAVITPITAPPPPPDDWIKVEEKSYTSEPVLAIDNWVKVEQKSYTVQPSGGVPPPCIECDHDGDCSEGYYCSNNGCCVLEGSCGIDSDCPEGEVCKNGKCVAAEGEFPWTYIVIGGAVVAAALLLIPKQEKVK